MTPAGKIEPQDWMMAPETQAVLAALSADGAEPRFVGGCVRDAVAGRPVKDVDLATPDPPERVTALLERAGIKAVPTGLEHGTVTAVSGGRPFEVTTLRVDVETYGRRARVAYTDDWQADAARRDLTINALSCAPDGTLYDPFGGLGDLRDGRVRFIGDPRQRIREDYLRLLRFFRFHAHYGKGGPDPEGLAAATELAAEATDLSGERVRDELLKLLAADDPLPVLELMHAHGVLRSFLPETAGMAALAGLLTVEPDDDAPDSLRRLAAVLEPDLNAAEAVAKRLRLSRAERERLGQLLSSGGPPDAAVRVGMPETRLRVALYRLGAEAARDGLLLDWARRPEDARSKLREDLQSGLAVMAAWRPIRFPLQGRDAVALGIQTGPGVGALLTEIEAWWIAEDFQPDRQACLARLKNLAADAAS
ncbi:MAG: CCA tRNA nucleotidyltransferase [Kiloniellales bacterium]